MPARTAAWGIIDSKNTVVIPFQYDEMTDFGAQGLAQVTLSGKVGVIDRTGVSVVQTVHDKEERFSDTLLRLTKYGRMAYYVVEANRYV